MAGILWAIIVILVLVWIFGFFLAHLGSFIWIALVIAVILLIYNIITGRGARV
ncbi:MAG: lmo0937 family membrane protein [Candidatus Eremiobacteraeota bacterium]|nr:lmo0937 family membrane protein [Candidatus Eremiobacteraeota bacterium]